MTSRSVPVFQAYRFQGRDGVWWRLVSPNGRSLARSTQALPTAEAANAEVAMVISERESLEPSVRVTEGHRWRWELLLESVPVVCGSGEQDRRVRCEAAWRAFVACAGHAASDPVVRVFHPGGVSRVALAAR